MTPRSGRSNPAIILISEVLPAPEAPNRPVTRPWLSNEASSENSPSCLVISTRSMSVPMQALGGASREPLRRDQGAHRDHDRDDHQTCCRRIAIGGLDQRID